MLMIRWPNKITNEEIYERTKEQKWSKKIKIRRLRWIWHLMRLEDAPTHLALQEALKEAKKPWGKPKTTWISKANQDLKELNPKLKLGTSELKKTTEDRKQ